MAGTHLFCKGIFLWTYFEILHCFESQTEQTGLAQSVERMTAEREVVGLIPGAGPLLRVFKKLRTEGNLFALQAAEPSRGSDDQVKWRSRLL